MGKSTLSLTEPLYEYILSQSLCETSAQAALRKRTDEHEMARMQISADQGQFMALLIKLMGARNIIEIGTYTGYSALCFAQALPEDGKIIACDISKEWTAIGQPYWEQAGVEDKIDLRIAPAEKTLRALIDTPEKGQFDFCFIDADKTNQLKYYDSCLQLIRPGGVIAIDNVLWGGSVIDTSDQSEDTVAIREFNRFVYNDDRVEISLVPIGDGLTLARKK